MQLDYSDHPCATAATAIAGTMASVRSYLQRDSYGKTDIAVTVTPVVYRMPQPSTYYNTLTGTRDYPAWYHYRDDALSVFGVDYDPTLYDRVILHPLYNAKVAGGVTNWGRSGASGCS